MELKPILFSLLFLAVGIGLIWFGWGQYQNQQADIQQAVEVEGTVESTEIDEVHRSEGTDDYEAVVRYTYSYEGQEYTSESLYPGPEKTFDNRAKAEEVLGQFSAGETTTVYVNQEDPSRAFLIQNQTLEPFFIMGGGVLFAVAGLILSGRSI